MPDTGNGSEDSEEISINRRKALKTIGATSSLGLLAGCGGGGDGEDDDTPAATPTPRVETVIETVEGEERTVVKERTVKVTEEPTDSPSPTATPDQIKDQPFRMANALTGPLSGIETWGQNPKSSFTSTIIFQGAGAKQNALRGEHLPVDWKSAEPRVDQGDLLVTLREGQFFHQGTEKLGRATAEDWGRRFDLMKVVNDDGQLNDPFVDYEIVDDSTISVKLPEEGVNPRSVALKAHGGPIHADSEEAGLIESGLDATTDDELDSVRSDIAKVSHKLDGNGVLSGPWMVSNPAAQELTAELVPGHWLEDHLNYREFKFKRVGQSGNQIWQALNSKSVDWGRGGVVPSVTSASLIPDHLRTILRGTNSSKTFAIHYQGAGGIPEYMQVGQDEVATEKVAKIRQGIAYAISGRNALVARRGAFAAKARSAYTKIHPGGPKAYLQEQWPDLWSALPEYGPGAKPEKAAQKFREAGLSKDGGTWMTPNGNPLKLVGESFTWDQPIMGAVQSSLQEVGVEFELSQVENSSLIGKFGSHDQPSDTGSGYHNNTGSPEVIASSALEEKDGNWMRTLPPGEYEIPEIGDFEGSIAETFDIQNITDGFQTEPPEDHPEAFRKAVWTFVYHLPTIPMYYRAAAQTASVQNFDWPKHIEGQKFQGASVDTHAPVWGADAGRIIPHGWPGVEAK